MVKKYKLLFFIFTLILVSFSFGAISTFAQQYVPTITYKASIVKYGGISPVSSVTVNKPSSPSSLLNGDLMIAQVITGGSNVTITPPIGWSQVVSNANGSSFSTTLYWKRVSNDPASYTWSLSSPTTAIVTIVAYANVSDLTSGSYETNFGIENSAHVTAQGITTTADSEMLVYFGTIFANATITAPPGMTSRLSGPVLQVADQLLGATNIATGAKTGEASVVAYNMGQLLALHPSQTVTAAASVTTDTPAFRAYMAGIENSLRATADTIEYGGTAPTPAPGNTHVVYPGPSGITASDQYSVRISSSQGVPYVFDNSFVYKSLGSTYIEQDTSWTNFSFSGSILVGVTKTGVNATTCAVRPNKYQITAPVISGGKCYFVLNSPMNVSVEINGDKIHPMLVFANPLEINPPTGPSSNVIYFGPGVYNIGRDFPLQSNQTVYLAGGAYVKGSFLGNGLQNVVIRGRGVLSGEQFAAGGNGLIKVTSNGAPSSNIVVDGITLVNSPFYNIDLQANRATVRNTKMISWEFSTDGVGCGANCLIENNFIKVNDDSIRVYLSNTIATNNVIWQLTNGAPFQISWNLSTNQSNFYVHDNIVLRSEHQIDQPNNAIFDSYHAGTATLSNYLFENISVEDVNWRLFYLSVQQNDFAPPPCCFGRVTDIVFNNITTEKPMQILSWVFGYDTTHTVDHVKFNNLKINGTLITPLNQGSYFHINPTTTNNITFTNNPL